MLQIKYQNIFLDIAPNQQAEMEKNNPMFLLDNIIAEYSTPISICYSEKNVQALGLLFFDSTVKTKSTFTVEIYTNGTYRGNASMIIESAGMNRDFAQKATIAGYLLTGISSFFTQIKGVKLTDLSLGGVRIYQHTTDNPLDDTNGFWQLFQRSYDFTEDFVALPCRNMGYSSDEIQFTFAEGWMNKYDGTKIVTKQNVVPWPKFEYVLTQIFAEHGWKLDTTGIDDEEWKRVILYSNYQLPTCTFSYNATFGGVVSSSNSAVNIELSKAMPPEKLCSTFVLEFCKRFFWFPLCDANTRTCKIIALRNAGNAAVKDWTGYAYSGSSSDFTLTEKIFAFKNTIEGEDNYPSGAPDKTKWNIGYADSYYLLPNAANYVDADTLFYTFFENKWWRPEWDSTTHQSSWVIEADNIYDEDPGNATDPIETLVSTLPVRHEMFPNGFYGLVPVVNQERKTNWGIRCVLYHGMTSFINGLGQELGVKYPYGSCVNTTPFGKPRLLWSNVWIHSNILNDYGIVEYWGKKWLKLIGIPEVIKRSFELPLSELMLYRWNDIITVQNIAYLIRSYREPLDYKSENIVIEATLQKLDIEPYLSSNVGEQDPGSDQDVHFTSQQTLSGTETTYHATQYLHGKAGAVVTIKVIEYSESNPDKWLFKINESETYMDNTFVVTLDGNGNGQYNVSIYTFLNYPAEHGGARYRVQIINTSIGGIGTPDTAMYSKAV